MLRGKTLKIIWMALVLPLCFGCQTRWGGGDQARNRDCPNILLITIESLRADHVGCYGYTRNTTPALDALSEQGITFDNAFSVTSWTLPTHTSIFTGLYPTAHQTIMPRHRLRDDYTTLAELLRQAGYQTAAFASGPLLRKFHNLDQGFEIYDDSAAEMTNAIAHSDITNPQIEKQLTSFLKNRRSSNHPFFLFAYFWDPHYDYIPPHPYDDQFVPADALTIDVRGYETRNAVHRDILPRQLDYVVAQYDGEIRCTDDMLGRLFKLLCDLELWDETVVIVTADHGEEFFEHGTKGHKNNLHVESLHVPLVIKPSGSMVARHDDRVVSLVDLFPTVLDFSKVDTDQLFHGCSVMDPPSESSRPIFFELVSTWYLPGETKPSNTDTWLAVRDGDYKLIGVEGKGRWELFDVRADPQEFYSLGFTQPAKSEHLRRTLKEHMSQMQRVADVWGTPELGQFTAEHMQRLESLGYIGGGGADDQTVPTENNTGRK